jgi:hypothetical protein
MAELVAAYPVGAFTDPQNGNSPVDADEVRANDDAMRSSFNGHDGDATIHFQSSLIATRPAAGTVGRKWFTSDSFQVFRDNGSSWDEIDYLNKTNGGTVAGATTFTGTLTSTAGSRTFGATTFSGTITGTAASFSSTISAAGATLTGALTGTSAAFSGAVSVGALTATTGVFTGTINVNSTNGLALGSVPGRRRLQSVSASAFSLLTDTDSSADLAMGALTATTGAFSGGHIIVTGGVNPYLDLDDGSGAGFVQIVAGDINLSPRAGKSVTISSDFNVGAGKFVVAGSTGNTTVAGTLGVTGDISASNNVTINGQIAVANNFAVNTNKFTVTAASGNTSIAGTLGVAGDITGTNLFAGSVASLIFGARSFIASPADGNLKFSNQAGTDFGLLQFGGTSSSFPALKRSTTGLLLRLADDSNYSFLRASSLLADSLNFSNFVGTSKILGGTTGTVIRNNADNADNLLISDLGAVTTRSTFQSGASIVAEATSSITWSGRSVLKSPSDGTLTLLNNAASGFTMLQFGGTTSSFYAVKQGLVGGLPALRVRLADDSADAGVQCSQLLVGTGGISTQGSLSCSDGPVSANTDVSAGGVFKKSGTQVVGARNTGWTVQTITGSKASLGTLGTVTVAGLAQWASAIQAALEAHGLLGA